MANTPQVTPAYAMQHTASMETAQTFLRSKRKTVELPLSASMLAEGRIEHSANKELVTFTRAQLIEGLTLATNIAIEHGPNSCRNLPNAGKAISVINALAVKHTVSRGVNKGEKRIAMLQGQSVYRGTLKRIRAAAERTQAENDGTAWYADGVVDKDGVARTYTSEQKARKAHARMTHDAAMAARMDAHAKMTKAQRKKNPLVITTWYEDADVKADLLKNAVVSQDAMDFYEAPVPAVKDMSAPAIIGMAKANGAPKTVTSGTGASKRSANYLLDNGLAV